MSPWVLALGSFTTLQFVAHAWLASAAISGGFVGTYITIKIAKPK
jgi:hypothetical protein